MARPGLRAAAARVLPIPSPLPTGTPPPPVDAHVEKVRAPFGDLWMRGDDQVMLPYLLSAGVWEREEGELLRSLARPGCRFLDVGANVGYFSALIAHSVTDVTVIAVEPEPRNLALLRLNLWQHAPAAEVWGCALTAGDRIVSIASTDGNPGDTRVDAGADKSLGLAAGMTGDELLAGRAVDLVKIDVQGFELDVVRGLAQTLHRNPRVVLVAEFLPEAIRDRGIDPATVLRGYHAAGLEIAAHIAGRVLPSTDAEVLRTCANAGSDGFVNLVLRQA